MKIWSAQIFCFCNSNVTTFPTSRKCKNFNFSLYSICSSDCGWKCCADIFKSTIYNQKTNFQKNSPLTNFQNRSFGWKWWRRLFWLKISSAQTFCFCNSNVTTFPTSRKCKNFNFSLYTVPAEMLYLQKYLTNFQKLSFGPERWGRWLLWLKISSAQIFWLCNSNVTTFPTSRKRKNFNFSL